MCLMLLALRMNPDVEFTASTMQRRQQEKRYAEK
jgi:hypothetical protein